VPWCETTWSEEMVKLRTGPFGPLVEEAFVKHGITQVTMAAQITEEKWKQARVPLQRALGCGVRAVRSQGASQWEICEIGHATKAR
jgi:hypothetical protein